MFKKVLIANRGEIALRVLRACKELEIRTVAVHSDVDRDSLHVSEADESFCIGPGPAGQSYLNIHNLISAALVARADAIHPGYGFLAENPEFVEICQSHGLVFIGPPAQAMRQMGDKAEARRTVIAAGVPTLPGTSEISDFAEAHAFAAESGFPVMIKAAAGGGGKGMRIVHNEQELPSQMERAISEASSAFGDGAVFIEKYIASPRHIEIQVLADAHGNVVHLFERECSVQRRHQKVVEEAPSSVLTPEVRAAMGQAAVMVAKACRYKGAGTVEFLIDEQLNFYFLEMNTRLQVEHPVTELISGVDLVEQQIRIARGETLSFSQDDLQIRGHALELRVYAEDPYDNFHPSIGKLEVYRRPQGEGIRVDDGFEEGMEIPIYYDPMIAKLITYGETRSAAIHRMLEAIELYQIEGVATTLPFGKFVCEHEAFTSGRFDTHFVQQYFNLEALKESNRDEGLYAALLALQLYTEEKRQLHIPEVGGSNWKYFR